ncbi:MAG: hypothetical protein M3Q23_12430 [Actinomycetota bacterium]|nr:hypothetical protein [Actinomycetota bacterium]
MRARVRLVVALAITSAMIAGVLFSANARTGAKAPHVKNMVLRAALRAELGQAKWPWRAHLSSGTVYTLLDAAGVLNRRAAAASNKAGSAPALPPTNNTQGCQNTYVGAGITNIRVNQDCSRRRQAEETIAANPTNALNYIVGQNDSSVGFNQTGYDWTLNHGQTWGSQIPPWRQFIGGDGHTFDAISDPTAAFDGAGNAYIGGVLFDINSPDTAILVEKSNAGINGEFYHSPFPDPFQTYRDSPYGVVASHDDPCFSDDKEYVIADQRTSGPKAGNVYMTWTLFRAGAAVGCSSTGIPGSFDSPIFFSQSTTGGATWSAPLEISGANSTFCTAFSAESNPNACDNDQGSDPIVGPDGTVYVSFFNGSTPTAGLNQWMIVKCPVVPISGSGDCSSISNWTGPYEITDDQGFQPSDPASCTPSAGGRQCLPPDTFRVQDETYGSVSVDSAGRLYFVWSDGRNLGSNCRFTTPGVHTSPCNTDVFMKSSTSGGVGWSSLFNITSPFGNTAQYMSWSQVTKTGSSVSVGFYDRHYGSCESTGCNDITLAQIATPLSPTAGGTTFQRITTASMPNLVAANNPVQAGFLGDYMWVINDARGNVDLVWADTRGLNGTVEEDVYYATVGQHEP